MKPENFLDAISALIQAKSEAEALQVLKDHPEILSDEADIMLRQLISNAKQHGDARAEKILGEMCEFLRTLRSSSSRESSQEGSELSKILQVLSRPAQLGDMPKRIELCRRALELVPLQQNAVLWVALQNSLGNCLAQSPLGDQADNVDRAIERYELALEVYTEKDFPEQWAATQNNLATAYSDRIQGNRADNIEQAIEHFKLALEVYTEKDFPEQWAAIQNNLGLAHSNRIRGDRADNIEQAIEHCELALKVTTQKDFPIEWAETQNNLGHAYKNRILDDRADNIEQAIEHFKLALKVCTEKDFPAHWATIQNNLANAYNNRIRSDLADNFERAIEHCELALKVRTQKDFPADWAKTQNTLANAYKNRIQGDRADNIEESIAHYEQALKVYMPGQFPDRCRGTAYSLGNLCLEGQRFPEAGKAYTQGMEAAEELYKGAIFQSSREAEMSETRDLYRRAGYALARSGDAMKAVEALERGRARGLGDALARDRADLERVREKDPESYHLYWQAIADLQNLESQERAGDSAEGKASPPARDLMMQARTCLGEALDRIRRIPGYTGFLKEPGWREIEASVIVGQPLVYLAAAPAGGVALIVHRLSESQEAVTDLVNLDTFSEQRLQELLKIWFDAYSGWQEALENLRRNKISAEEYFQAQGRWFDAIEMVTGQLWEDVMEPIYGILQSLKAQQASLIPTGLLSLLPLHAAWKEEDGRKRYLQELLPVSYIPSALALTHARRNAHAADRLLAVDEPRPVRGSPLPNSHAEVTAIGSLFENPQILEHEGATRSAVRQALPGAQVAHFSCHGGANWNDPEISGLLMANDEILTVKDLFELHLDGARLATLSACETGVPGMKLPDEVVSLPSAFIRAGFAGAIGSLWTVSDESTAQLMTSFYRLWREKGMPPVQALAEAQKMLHESEKFQHPFYWAAFYLTGI